MRNRIYALAIMILCMLLTIMPAVAASNLRGSMPDADYLIIYGNANLDETIDEDDVAYVNSIINGSNNSTKLSDANFDGKIDAQDIDQIDKIIRGEAKELTIIDSQNRISTIKLPITRVISTLRGQLEMLRILGVPAKNVVGVETLKAGAYPYENFFSEYYQDAETIGTVSSPDIEKMLSLKPDCILFLYSFLYKESGEKQFNSADISLVHLNCGIFDKNVSQDIMTLGYLFNRVERAQEFIEWQEGIMNLVEERLDEIPEKDKLRVYFEGEKTYWTDRDEKGCINYSGGKSIFSEVTNWQEIDPEAVVERNPEVIIKLADPSTNSSGYYLEATNTSMMKEIRDEIANRPELKNIDAVKNGRVYVVSMFISGTGGAAGCRGFLQKIYTAKWLYPDLFKDLDPKAIHQEYLTRFQGLDIDLNKTGVFVYPEPS